MQTGNASVVSGRSIEMEIGFIRLGHVGAPMALNLLKGRPARYRLQSHYPCERPVSTRIAFSTF